MIRFPRLAVAALLCVLTIAITWPQASRMSSVSDFGDPLLNAWALAWVGHASVSAPLSVFDANIFHPERATLAYSETLLLPGLLLAPAHWLGADPIVVLNVLALGSYVLSGLAMFALVRALTGAVGPAVVAAVIYAFFPYRTEHYAKVQMLITWWLPLCLLAVHRLTPVAGASALTRNVSGTPWRPALWLGVLLAAQAYSSMYLAVYGAIVLAVIGALLLAATPASRRLTAARGWMAAVAIGLVLSAPLGWAYSRAAAVVGVRSAAELRTYSAELRDYRRPHPENALYGDRDRPGPAERRLFPGYAAPALAIVGLVAAPPAVAVAYGAGMATAVGLSLGVNTPVYRALYDWLWPLRALRVPARFGMIAGLVLAVMAGWGIAGLGRGRSARVRTAIAGCAVALVVAESWNRPLELSTLADPQPAVYEWLAQQPPGVVCEFPVGPLRGRVGPQDPTYMYYSTRHWLPLVNGYSGFAPASYRALLDRLAAFPDDTSVEYLRERGVTYLLVHSAFYITGDFDRDIRLLRARSDLTWRGSFPWRDGNSSHVFSLPVR